MSLHQEYAKKKKGKKRNMQNNSQIDLTKFTQDVYKSNLFLLLIYRSLIFTHVTVQLTNIYIGHN